MTTTLSDRATHSVLKRLEAGAFSSLGAFVILRGAAYVGRIYFHKSTSGTVHAFCWDWTCPEASVLTGGRAVVGGGDAWQEALSGCTFGGVPFLDWGGRIGGETAPAWREQLENRGFTVISVI